MKVVKIVTEQMKKKEEKNLRHVIRLQMIEASECGAERKIERETEKSNKTEIFAW